MQLLNQLVRTFNNTIELCELERDTYMAKLSRDLDSQTFSEHELFLSRIMENRHQNTLECQGTKINRLCHKSVGSCSNQDNHVTGNTYNNIEATQTE